MSVKSIEQLNKQLKSALQTNITILNSQSTQTHKTNLTKEMCISQKIQFSNNDLLGFINDLSAFLKKRPRWLEFGMIDGEQVLQPVKTLRRWDLAWNDMIEEEGESMPLNQSDLSIQEGCTLYTSVKVLTEQIVGTQVENFHLSMKHDLDLGSSINGTLNENPGHGMLVINLSKGVNPDGYHAGVLVTQEAREYRHSYEKTNSDSLIDFALLAKFYAMSADDVEKLKIYRQKHSAYTS